MTMCAELPKPTKKQPAFLRHRGSLERAVADQSSAQQRRDVFVIEVFGQRVCEVLRDNSIFRVPTINVVTGIPRVAAQILASTPAELAGAVHMLQPGDADPPPDPQAHHTVAGFVHSSNNLMAGDDRHPVRREIPLDNVKIGAANSADAYFHPNLARPRSRRVHFSLSQRQLLHALLLRQDHRAHGFKISNHLLRW
jgi:hypothetical protein